MRSEMVVSNPLCLSIALLAFTVLGCAGKGGEEKGQDQSAGVPGESIAAPVTSTEWVLSELGDKAAIPAGDALARPRFAMDAREKRVRGSTGVNQINGTFELSGDALQFGPLATTRRAGPPELMQQESVFLDALSKTATARVNGSSLRLLDGAGNVLARFDPMSVAP